MPSFLNHVDISEKSDIHVTVHRDKFLTIKPTRCTNLSNLFFGMITAKAELKFGSEAWVLKKREEQRLEAAKMKFLRHLLGITKLDKEKNHCIIEKNRSREYSKGNKTVPEKVATTHREDGHKQDT